MGTYGIIAIVKTISFSTTRRFNRPSLLSELSDLILELSAVLANTMRDIDLIGRTTQGCPEGIVTQEELVHSRTVESNDI